MKWPFRKGRRGVKIGDRSGEDRRWSSDRRILEEEVEEDRRSDTERRSQRDRREKESGSD